jgi:peptide/nickel transport system ATP-binding protein
MTPVLQIASYTLDYNTRAGPKRVLDNVTLTVGAGEVVGLVGESGSGKSTLAWAITRHLPKNAREISGAIRLNDLELLALSSKDMSAVRGRRIGMVFQDPATALNPTLTLGRQVTEVLERHRGMTPAAAKVAAVEALNHVGLGAPDALLRRYPHEVSGGEKQRVVIATTFACRPEVIIFDEPTTALDVITGARVLELFRRLREETGVAALYISHDLGLVSQIADRVAVIHNGRIVEEGPATSIFRAPREDYTSRLVASVPRPDRRLVHDGPQEAPVLAVRNLSVTYARPTLFGRRPVAGNQGLTLELRQREILGVVGESGSGKSSLARAVTGLVDFAGEVEAGERQFLGPKQMDRAYRNRVQIIFQHPDTSLNPRQSVREILARPLRLSGGNEAEIPRLLDQVRLPAGYVRRYPHELSGGEKQRVAIARAFAPKPAVVICDEITASLDVSVQRTIIELLLTLRQDHGTAYLFITHDLNLVRQIAHRLAVMRRGELLDVLPVEAFAADGNLDAAHPYTRELNAATPRPVG